MSHDYSTIEQLAQRLCAEAGGNWEKRRKYWVRKAAEIAGRNDLIVDFAKALRATK